MKEASPGYLAAVVAVSVAVTLLLRALPFILFGIPEKMGDEPCAKPRGMKS